MSLFTSEQLQQQQMGMGGSSSSPRRSNSLFTQEQLSSMGLDPQPAVASVAPSSRMGAPTVVAPATTKVTLQTPDGQDVQLPTPSPRRENPQSNSIAASDPAIIAASTGGAGSVAGAMAAARASV